MEGKGSNTRSLGQTIDWQLIGIYLVLVLIGWLNIYASIHSTEPASIFSPDCRSGKQFIWIMTSLVLAVLILFVFNPKMWEVLSAPAYVGVLILLVAVIFLGTEVKGSRSWFSFGAVSFQPAELSKITTSLFLAQVMSQQNFKITNFKDLLKAALLIGLPMLIIVAESETGSALVYVGFIFVLYREGLTGWIIFFLGMIVLLFILTIMFSPLVAAIVLVVVAVVSYFVTTKGVRRKTPRRRAITRFALLALISGLVLIESADFVFDNVLRDHQRQRIEVLLGMKEDPTGVGYNVRQSMIAIGSGGLIGKGYLNGTQTTYGFVPEQSTDFIFCTVGEEWGFLGCMAVILLYGWMIYRIIKDAEESREAFTRIYGYCLASCIFMHLFINVSMTIGLMPVIGIPLPFLSYGGSSMWAFTTMLFIFIALNRQEKKYF
ncbi:MAG: rod shape-determining protein RodA [Bacteroidales bacterium]|nr:rod shape-determining protein RodA [Bacteroidales bacterium]